MNRRGLLKAMGALGLCPLCVTGGFAAEGTHWSYAGENGPDKWGALGGDGNACSIGDQQSPVDITGIIGARLPRRGTGRVEQPLPRPERRAEDQARAAAGGDRLEYRIRRDVIDAVAFGRADRRRVCITCV